MALYISLKRGLLHVLVCSTNISVWPELYIATVIHNFYIVFSNLYNVEIDAAWALSQDD